MAEHSNSTPLPGDNRAPVVRLTDDITSLARMASINFEMSARALCPSRAVKRDKDHDLYTFSFSGDWLGQLYFAAADVMERAQSIVARAHHLSELTPVHAEQAGTTDRYDLLSNLEGALALISGFAEAIDELSGTKNDPARRLSGICAIAGPVHEEIERAKQVCRDLYQAHFAEKSTG